MRTRYVHILLFFMLAIFLAACQLFLGEKIMAKEPQDNLSQSEIPLGRFTITVPPTLTLAASKYVVHHTRVSVLDWTKEENPQLARDAYWQGRLSHIKGLRKPKGVDDIIIEEKDFQTNTKWTKGVLYYSSYIYKKEVTWEVLQDFETHGVVYTIGGTIDRIDKINMALLEVMDSFKFIPADSVAPDTKGPKFQLINGVVKLPYIDDEQLYFRLENEDKSIKFEINMKVVHKVEKTNIIERLSASLASNFAPGVSIDKIRTNQRAVAGLEGDEVVMRGTEDGDSSLSFAWRFNGEKKSAIAPRFSMEMETEDGNLEEKLELWDSLLDSIKVIPQS